VIAVGNLEVGGSGKTPFALWLLEQAVRSGMRAAYASRGYGSAAERGPLVTVVSDQAPASFDGMRLLGRNARNLADAIGDEGAVVARRADPSMLLFARDKRRAVEAAARLGAEVIVVDDAYQTFSMPRHVDVLLLDARRPLANGRLLPAGRLREPASAIARADAIVFNGASDLASIHEARGQVARWLRPQQRVYGLRREVTLSSVTAPAVGTPVEALLVAGIARPGDFKDSVEQLGVRVRDVVAFRDHHRYRREDARDIVARARGGAVVVTEKDWVKLARFDWGSTPVWVARLEVRLLGEDDDGSWILQRG